MYRLRHRNRNKQRKILVISICSILLFMTVGYAAMNTNLEINAKGNVIKKTSLGEDLIKLAGVVESGDGLYKDAYEDNVYTYRGSNPNNYVTFNEESWRIISVNTSDNTIKIIKTESLGNIEYDRNNGRYQGDDGYCNYNDVCNIWGSKSTLYDSNLSPISTLSRENNGIKLSLPEKEAKINIYLNSTYFNGLNSEAQNMIINGMYKVGNISYDSSDIISDIEKVSLVKWKGKVALLDVTEYARAGNNNKCNGLNSYFSNSQCYNYARNWIFDNSYLLTLTPLFGNFSFPIWFVYDNGKLDVDDMFFSGNVRPVVTLSPEVKIVSGDGSQNNSYQLS